MQNSMILLVEDDPNDELLTLRALKMSNIKHEVIAVHDGVEALDFLFCRNTYADRDPHDLPQLILLDIKLPKMGRTPACANQWTSLNSWSIYDSLACIGCN